MRPTHFFLGTFAPREVLLGVIAPRHILLVLLFLDIPVALPNLSQRVAYDHLA